MAIERQIQQNERRNQNQFPGMTPDEIRSYKLGRARHFNFREISKAGSLQKHFNKKRH